ncbi:MAG TPA: inorganic phosphate transporter [Bryobacteraceae bacterium]|jgi:PiT family inorganic phosphate transporter|nr:inorganic phosphate transporter [Bryobacteraceae bacterium]
MASSAQAAVAPSPTTLLDKKIKRNPGKIGVIIFGTALLVGGIYAGWNLLSDLSHVQTSSALVFVLLGFALAIALGFEFVNGFHDTANAVATVIYTHTLEPHVAVVYSGILNFVGVLTSSGAVAFGIVSLLPVELILQVGSAAGFSMVFALLVAAIMWNLGTWYFGIPNSSSHALVGSIMGVGLANQLMATSHTGTTGVDWAQALKVGESLLFSPIIGFCASALLLLLMKKVLPQKELYSEPHGDTPPPFWIRGLLMLTCGGVSFAHGSNDGQKGMGLIMLILVGTVPTAYALNHAVGYEQVQTFVSVSQTTSHVLDHYIQPGVSSSNANLDLERFVSSGKLTPQVMPALKWQIDSISQNVGTYKTLALIPTAITTNVRNQMYLTSETLRLIEKKHTPRISAEDNAFILNYKKQIDHATKFIPNWVKVAVALALGLGTMVGWKRIVVTVGERIGKTHLTYAQGAASELVAMTTILASDVYGLPVSTTHVLTSGVAGTMAANHSGLQWSTIRSLAMAWVLTLPCSMALSGMLYWLFRHL